MVQTISSYQALAQNRSTLENQTLGFVPTMGALHPGHLSLMKTSLKTCSQTWVSIFVNPTQFGPHEDYQKYPRPIEQDLKVCQKVGVDVVWTPQVEDIYTTEKEKKKIPFHSNLFDILCGKYRPGHFAGVVQVVHLLLQQVRPTHLFLGEKDFQQLVILKKMVQFLKIPTQVIGCPTVREQDGLAMSSRNQYLSNSERKAAPFLYQGLLQGKSLFEQGETNPEKLLENIRQFLNKHFSIQYLEAVDSESLKTPAQLVHGNRILVAAYLGSTRLIDNIEL